MAICEDHLGNKYSSKKIMCDHYGISYATYKRCIQKGWTIEQALTIPFDERIPKKENSKQITVKDHLGNIYPDLKTMCEYYDIHPHTYKSRIRCGWSIEKALTTPVSQHLTKKRPQWCIPVKDHLGNFYLSKEDMCKNYNICRSTFDERIKKGLSLKDALTKPKMRNGKPIPDDKPIQNGEPVAVYRSLEELCQANDIDPEVLTANLRDRQSWRSVSGTHVKYGRSQTDHLGNVFTSEAEMCRFHHIKVSTYKNRIEYGMSLKDALTRPVNSVTAQTDPFGNVFKNIRAICDHYNVPADDYNKDLKSGRYTQAEVLGIVPRLNYLTKNVAINNRFIILSQISRHDRQHFLCLIDDHEIVMKKTQIVDYWLEQLKQDIA